MKQKLTIPVFYPQYPINESKHFLSLYLSLGTRHIDESVFAFILAGNLASFKRTGKKQSIHHLYGYSAHSAQIIIRVWGIVYLSTALLEPPADKRKCLTLSIVDSHSWGGVGNRNNMEKRKVRFYVQETPDAGFMDYAEGVDPTETKEGYYMGIIHEPYGDSTNMISRSLILIEQEDMSIITILPKRLIRFEE